MDPTIQIPNEASKILRELKGSATAGLRFYKEVHDAQKDLLHLFSSEVGYNFCPVCGAMVA